MYILGAITVRNSNWELILSAQRLEYGLLRHVEGETHGLAPSN